MKRFCLFITVFLFSVSLGSAQVPDAVANFVKVEKEITTTPEFPGICDLNIGIEVHVNETFQSYL